MVTELISSSPSPHGKKRTRGGSTRARGSRSVGLVPREGRVTTATKREEGCGPRHAAKIEARGCARTSLFHRLQKSIGDHCRPHRSFSTGPTAGLTARWAGSERGPSPRRRTLLTREKSWTEAEPRVKQASRDAGPMRGCAHRGFTSRPASVQPSCKRVGQNPARGTVDPASRRSASFAHAKWPLSMEGVPDRTNRRWSRGSGRSGLGGSCPGGPTRRRERWSQENRSGRGDRSVRGRSHGPRRRITSPARSRSLEER